MLRLSIISCCSGYGMVRYMVPNIDILTYIIVVDDNRANDERDSIKGGFQESIKLLEQKRHRLHL